jgi:HSP20 family protein
MLIRVFGFKMARFIFLIYKKTNTMSTKSLMRMPTLMNDFFRPWNEWFDDGLTRTLRVPAVNICEEDAAYKLSFAVPGMKKSDFEIDVDGNQLTISCSKEEKGTEKNTRYTRKEYSYEAFERSFTMPDEINRDRIDASYEDGVLMVTLPKKEEARRQQIAKHIAVK